MARRPILLALAICLAAGGRQASAIGQPLLQRASIEVEVFSSPTSKAPATIGVTASYLLSGLSGPARFTLLSFDAAEPVALRASYLGSALAVATVGHHALAKTLVIDLPEEARGKTIEITLTYSMTPPPDLDQRSLVRIPVPVPEAVPSDAVDTLFESRILSRGFAGLRQRFPTGAATSGQGEARELTSRLPAVPSHLALTLSHKRSLVTVERSADLVTALVLLLLTGWGLRAARRRLQ